jgi:hypothetical protein
MRALSFAVILAACGSSSPPPATPTPAPTPTSPPTTVTQPAPVEPEPEPPPTPAPAPPLTPPKPLAERLRDDSGDVAGLAGWKIERKADANHCSGFKIVTTRGKKKLSADDQQLANVYALTFPTGLNFEPGEKTKKVREASMKKLNEFVEKMTKVGGEARKHYEEILAKRDARTSIDAIARMAQVQIRLSSLLVRAEIPKDVRTGEFAAEKTEAFCSRLTEVAEPLAGEAERATQICIDKAAELQVAPGWWSAICTK